MLCRVENKEEVQASLAKYPPIPTITEVSLPQDFIESEAYYLSAFEWKLGRAVLENKLFKIPTKSMMVN